MKDRNSLYKRVSIPQAGFLSAQRDPALMRSSDPAETLAAELRASLRGEVRRALHLAQVLQMALHEPGKLQ